jgi:hypothetical protein
MILALLCALLVVSVSLAVWAVCWPEAATPPASDGKRCDLCDEVATVRLVATFNDESEQDLGEGGSAMTADYCPTHAAQVA